MAVDAEGRWVAGIGDPSPVGWVTVAAYLAVALLAARNAWAARRDGAPSSFWATLALAMFVLGLNKQLDLQSWFGQTGRDMAIAQGWYDVRRTVQAVFIVVLALGAFGVVLAARRAWAGLWHEYRFVFVGIVVLLVFIVIRAASFHHADEIIGIDVGGTNLGRAFEMLGVLTIGAACWHWHAVLRRRWPVPTRVR
jgi:hypothetical protein